MKGGAETGHGFLIKHGPTCYVVTPKHLTKGKRRATVFSSAPVVHSGAIFEEPFWDGFDLAVGVVRGPVEERCTSTLADFAAAAPIRGGQQAELVRIRPSGDFERVDMIITRSDYLTIDAKVLDVDQELFKGTSGAFLFDRDIPIGMIVEAITATEGRFVHIEELEMNLSRLLNRKIGFQTVPSRSTTSNDANPAELKNQIPVEFISATQPPTFPDFAEENVLGDGAYAFDLPRPNRIAFKVIGPDAVPLSSVKMMSDPNADYAVPRTIRIDVSSSLDGSRPRHFGSSEMGPDGLFDLTRSPTLVRWVFVTVSGAWENGALGIESIRFN